jgi:hypothetical protein
VKLVRLQVDEKVFVNAQYDGVVELDVTVAKPGSEAACWTGRVKGSAENYGEAGKAVNYAETMDHALDRALVSLLREQAFTDASCRTCR